MKNIQAERIKEHAAAIREAMELQNTLNITTNGEEWKDGINKHGKEIDWMLAASMEAAELIDSLPWKHWKNVDAAADWDNATVEIVDIFHFVLSEAIKFDENFHGVYSASAALSVAFKGLSVYEYPDNEKWKIAEVMRAARAFAAYTFSLDRSVQMEFEEMDKLLCLFAKLCTVAGLSLETLLKYYYGKNALNALRQEFGYANGSYVKMWDGKEDNVKMLEIVEQIPDHQIDTIRLLLEEYYVTSVLPAQ